MQNLLRPRVARPRKRPGRAGSPLSAASGIDSVLPAPTDPAARSRARKGADGRIPAQEAGSAQPSAARSGLRALPTLHFCGKPEVVGGTTFRVVHHVPQPVSGEEIGRKIFCGISTGVRQLRT